MNTHENLIVSHWNGNLGSKKELLRPFDGCMVAHATSSNLGPRKLDGNFGSAVVLCPLLVIISMIDDDLATGQIYVSPKVESLRLKAQKWLLLTLIYSTHYWLLLILIASFKAV